MAHVHGAKAAVEAGGKMAGTAMKMGEGMMHPALAGAVAGAVATTKAGLVRKILRHPLVWFGAGVALGVVAYKYRRELAEKAEHGE
ncbi:hypothetical protein PL263_09840 [Methylomonas sp. EFPC3]|uniref:hypothetical protein n=1 Tax=Methylomonas sp. EFPC3 TaxID=3021710 RepID=UPI0024176F3E|nr:hypothetical protein [Methylomonas sp. EFPC3]WFP52308.1 hypothetical protein PL263_09840 [Methylomonas sp. EFPC3]